MIVTAALAWFDEPLEQLDECVRSLPVIADRLVAVDGGYSRYPGAKAKSPAAQAAQIRKTAKDVGLDVVIHTPDKLWAGQVQKRSFLIQQAALGSDWWVPVDADHVLHGVRSAIRHELKHLDAAFDAVVADLFTPMNHDRPLDESAAGKWHKDLADRYTRIPNVFRSFPELRVERFHWWYSGLRGGKRIWLMGGEEEGGPRAKLHIMEAPYLIEHRCLFRQPKQILRNREFCDDRVAIVNATKQEDDPKMLVAA